PGLRAMIDTVRPPPETSAVVGFSLVHDTGASGIDFPLVSRTVAVMDSVASIDVNVSAETEKSTLQAGPGAVPPSPSPALHATEKSKNVAAATAENLRSWRAPDFA